MENENPHTLTWHITQVTRLKKQLTAILLRRAAFLPMRLMAKLGADILLEAKLESLHCRREDSAKKHLYSIYLSF